VAEVWELDMASYTSIKSFAQRASADLNRIDIVLENVATALDTWTEAEGMETSLTVNVLGTMLLAMLLLPKLKDTAKKYAIQPHLTVVTSGLGFQARFLENIKGDFLDARNKKENKLHQR
jgi:NAD(P)-dependent dehydrogenase (short-subunit alcohol dehydrogenase family)